MIQWIKNLFHVVRNYHEIKTEIYLLRERVKRSEKQVAEAVQVIRDRTDVSVGVSATQRSHSYVFMAGRYKNRDYVELFAVDPQDFKELVNILRRMQKHASIRRIDSAPYVNMKEHIKRDLGL